MLANGLSYQSVTSSLLVFTGSTHSTLPKPGYVVLNRYTGKYLEPLLICMLTIDPLILSQAHQIDKSRAVMLHKSSRVCRLSTGHVRSHDTAADSKTPKNYPSIPVEC